MCIICCKHAANPEATEEPPSGCLLRTCTLRPKYPAAGTRGACGDMNQRGIEAMSEHAGRANLDTSASIKDLHSCDPDLRSAHVPELFNAVELVDILHIAVMYAARYSRRPQRPRPPTKSQLASANETSSGAQLATMLGCVPNGEFLSQKQTFFLRPRFFFLRSDTLCASDTLVAPLPTAEEQQSTLTHRTAPQDSTHHDRLTVQTWPACVRDACCPAPRCELAEESPAFAWHGA